MAIYRNNWQQRFFGKKGSQNLFLGRVFIDDGSGASEKAGCEKTLTVPKISVSGGFGIYRVPVFLCLLLSAQLWGELDVSGYVAQVLHNNQDFVAMQKNRSAYNAISDEGMLIFCPQLKGEYSSEFAQDPQLIPYFPTFLSGADLINRNYLVKLEQNTPIGLDVALQSTAHFFEVKFFQFTPQQQQQFSTFGLKQVNYTWQVTQSVRAKQHLWKNGFGRQARARARHSKSSALAQSFLENYQLQQQIVAVENVYWQLVLAKEATSIRKESVHYAQKLLDHTLQKKRESLALESEVYTAKSILNTNLLEQDRAEDAEVALSLTFNSLRGISSPEVSESLVPLSLSILQKMIPTCMGIRGDLRVHEEDCKAKEAENEISIDDLLPDLNVSAFVGFTGTSPYLHSSFDMSWQNPAPSAGVVVELSFPLAPFKIRSVIRGYKNKTQAAKLGLKRARFLHDQQWTEYMDRLEQKKKILERLYESASLQKEKLDNAHLEYERGLNTFFDIMSAYNDYETSKISILNTCQVMLDILLNLSLYEERAYPLLPNK